MFEGKGKAASEEGLGEEVMRRGDEEVSRFGKKRGTPPPFS
jgi:hypothetical protein